MKQQHYTVNKSIQNFNKDALNLNLPRKSPFFPKFVPVRNPEIWTNCLEVSLEYLAVVHLTEQSDAFMIVAVVVVTRSVGKKFCKIEH